MRRREDDQKVGLRCTLPIVSGFAVIQEISKFQKAGNCCLLITYSEHIAAGLIPLSASRVFEQSWLVGDGLGQRLRQVLSLCAVENQEEEEKPHRMSSGPV